MFPREVNSVSTIHNEDLWLKEWFPLDGKTVSTIQSEVIL